MPTAPLSARINQTVKDDLLIVCERSHCSQSYHTEKALSEYIAREKNFEAQVQKGLNDLDNGRSVENDQVMAWLNSWETNDVLPMPKP